MDQLTHKINDLQESVEFTEKHLEEKIGKIESELQSKTQYLEDELKNLKLNVVTKKDLTHIRQKLIELEDRSRRNNLRIDGIPESYKETWDDCENKCKIFLTIS